MDIQHLEVFRAVATIGSLSRAADVLHIAQPALSRQIKSLEASLDVRLFVRTGRGMALTDAGHELLQQSASIVTEMRRLQDNMRSFNGVPSGQVVVGCVPTVSERIAGTIAEEVIRELPEVSLRLVEGYSGYLLNWMHRGDLDLAVIYQGDERPHVHFEPIAREELVAVGATNHWPNGSDTVSFSELATRPITVPGSGHGLRNIIDAAARQTRTELDVILEADSFRVLLDVVARGLAVTVLPKSALIGRHQHFSTAKIIDPELERGIAIAKPVGASSTLAIDAVLGLLRQHTSQFVHEA